MISVPDTAVLIALLLKRSEQRRARISEKTLKRIAHRRRLRSGFLRDLIDKLADRGILMIELNRGGFGLLPSSALESAPAIYARDHIPEEVRLLRRDESLPRAVLQEIEDREVDDEDDDGE